ncbi:MAG TPA: hypothetical protein VID93_06520 [Acidimicrobiales bacterium]|jgi:hypothetical protein
MLRHLLAAVLSAMVLVACLATPSTPSTAADTAPTTTLPLDSGDRSVIPAPNSGHEPVDSGDRGGWEQLLLFGIMAAGSILIFGRVLWAGHQRSRANQVQPQAERRP